MTEKLPIDEKSSALHIKQHVSSLVIVDHVIYCADIDTPGSIHHYFNEI